MDPRKELEEFLTTAAGHPTSINFEDDLLALGVLDSLTIMQLTSFIEERFSIRLELDDISPDHFRNLRSLMELIDRKVDQSNKTSEPTSNNAMINQCD